MPSRRNTPRRRRLDTIIAKFGSNLPRHLLYLERAVMQRLAVACEAAGHPPLRSGLLLAVLYLAHRGSRTSHLARFAGISQQSAGQLVNTLERRRLVAKLADVRDSRAHTLHLTPRGRRLAAAATRAAKHLDRRLSGLAGKADFREFRASCSRLANACIAAEMGGPLDDHHALALGLAGLAGYCERELMRLDAARGYAGLKLSFAQVLTYISPHGSLINDLARINDVSKQAIAQIVQELETLGFIERRRHPGDRRSSLIFLTPAGLRLIRASVGHIDVLERRFIRVLGAARLERFKSITKRLARDVEGIEDARPGTEWSTEVTLQQWLAALYRSGAEASRPQLFARAGPSAKLSAAALKILAVLEIRLHEPHPSGLYERADFFKSSPTAALRREARG